MSKISEAKKKYAEGEQTKLAEQAKIDEAKIKQDKEKANQRQIEYETRRREEQIHDEKIFAFNPAVKLMNGCKSAIENNLDTQTVIIDHIRQTGSDDNIYLYGIRSNYGGIQREGVYKFYPDYEDMEDCYSQDIAKDFSRCGTLTMKITKGEFVGYNIIGYGTNSLFMRFLIPDHRTYHIILRKSFFMKWFGWIRI